MARKKMKAVMEWSGRKLMCNGVCVARIGRMIAGKNLWWAHGGFRMVSVNFPPICTSHFSEAAARRAINRRFKIED